MAISIPGFRKKDTKVSTNSVIAPLTVCSLCFLPAKVGCFSSKTALFRTKVPKFSEEVVRLGSTAQ